MKSLSRLAITLFALFFVTGVLASRPRGRDRARSVQVTLDLPSMVNTYSAAPDEEYGICGVQTTLDSATKVVWSWWMKQNSAWGTAEGVWNIAEQFKFRTDSSNEFRFYLGTALCDGGSFVADTWYHFLVQYDGTETGSDRGKIYVTGGSYDGSNIVGTACSWSVTPPATMPSAVSQLVIGGGSGGSYPFGTGNFDELALWVGVVATAKDRSRLAETRITGKLYDIASTTMGTPAHWYRCGDTSGDSHTTIYDAAGSADCTLLSWESEDIDTSVP